MIVVSDTSPISNLFLVGYLSIVQKIYNRVVIPQAVADELSTIDHLQPKILLSDC